jgi:hypothetical protein
VAVPDIAGTKGGVKSQAVADLPIGARGRPPHHSATAKQYCPSSSAMPRHSMPEHGPPYEGRFCAAPPRSGRLTEARPAGQPAGERHRIGTTWIVDHVGCSLVADPWIIELWSGCRPCIID